MQAVAKPFLNIQIQDQCYKNSKLLVNRALEKYLKIETHSTQPPRNCYNDLQIYNQIA